MITDKIKTFVDIMLKRGHNIEVIKNSYLDILQSESDYDEILQFLSNNKSVSKEDVNYEIHKIYLKHRGINI